SAAVSRATEAFHALGTYRGSARALLKAVRASGIDTEKPRSAFRDAGLVRRVATTRGDAGFTIARGLRSREVRRQTGRQKQRQDDRSHGHLRTCRRLWPYIGPAVLLKLHHTGNSRGDNMCLRDQGDIFLLHPGLIGHGAAASGKGDVLTAERGEAILHRRGVAAKHVQTGSVSDEFNFHLLALVLKILC